MKALIVAGLLATRTAAGAAQETTGDIRGRLVTSNGAPVAGASVEGTGPDLPGTRKTKSAADGVFQLLSLPPGVYSVRIIAIGFAPVRLDSVAVQLGRTQGLTETRLQPAAVQLSEVRIAVRQLAIDPSRTTIGATLEMADLASLPAERDYKALITILPHVNVSYYAGDAPNAAGSTGLENMYFIDGVNVTAPLSAGGGTSLPSNFVRSVEVRTGGYEAQYGRALGAVVNAVTYTGTNRFESDVFGYFTHDALTAAPKSQPFLRESGAFSYDVGLRVSGPVKRDHLWFSAAYNPRSDHVDREIQGLGTFSDDQITHSFAGKLTWQPYPTGIIELSVFGDPASRDMVNGWSTLTPLNALPFLSRVETGGLTASLRATRSVGSSMLLEATVSRYNGRDNLLPPENHAALQPLVFDVVANTIEGSLNVLETDQGRTTGTMHGTLTSGRHTLGIGVEYEENRVWRRARTAGNGYIIRSDSATFTESQQRLDGVVHNRIPTIWLQDSWRPVRDLTVNVGVRMARQTFIGASGRVAQRLADEWQPRLGLSWQFDEAGEQRIFSSYGRFYQQEPLNFASLWYMDNEFLIRTYDSDPRLGGVPLRVDTLSNGEATYSRSIDGLPPDHIDESTLGYERTIGAAARIVLRGIYRNLNGTIQYGTDSAGKTVLGTPGRGALLFLPPPRRRYTALEVAAEGTQARWRYRASYVLSRTWGNYSGLYNSDNENANPGENAELAMPHQAVNSTGVLPNDRTHVGKLAMTYRAGQTLTVGGFFTAQSGTPLNEFGVGPVLNPYFPTFLRPRGSAGRTPAIWDLNLRLVQEFASMHNVRGRLMIDLMHVGNVRATVRQDQQRFYGLDEQGKPSNPNPAWRRATGFQPPMAARVGISMSR